MKLRKTLAALICCLALASCAPAPPSQPVEPVAAAPTLETDVYSTIRPGEIGGRGFAAEDGYYELLNWDLETCNIVFTDYATAKQRYVCPAAGCDHNGESCPSFVCGDNILSFVFVWNNKLYLYLYVRPQSDPPNAAKSSTLEEMELDGSNRRVVKTFDSETLITGFVAGCEDALVLSISPDNGVVTQVLLKLDPASGETEEFYRAKAPSGAESFGIFMYGTTERGFVAAANTQNRLEEPATSETPEELRKYHELYYNAVKIEFIEIPFDGGEPRDLISFIGDARGALYHDGAIYYIDDPFFTYFSNPDAHPSLMRLDCETLKIETLVENFTAVDGFMVSGKHVGMELTGFIDNYAAVARYYGTHDASGIGSAFADQFLVDLGTGEVKMTGLKNVYGNGEGGGNDFYAEIIADAGDRLLVTGGAQTINYYYVPQYALIPKADYYSSVKNYTMIEQLPRFTKTTPYKP